MLQSPAFYRFFLLVSENVKICFLHPRPYPPLLPLENNGISRCFTLKWECKSFVLMIAWKKRFRRQAKHEQLNFSYEHHSMFDFSLKFFPMQITSLEKERSLNSSWTAPIWELTKLFFLMFDNEKFFFLLSESLCAKLQSEFAFLAVTKEENSKPIATFVEFRLQKFFYIKRVGWGRKKIQKSAPSGKRVKRRLRARGTWKKSQLKSWHNEQKVREGAESGKKWCKESFTRDPMYQECCWCFWYLWCSRAPADRAEIELHRQPRPYPWRGMRMHAVQICLVAAASKRRHLSTLRVISCEESVVSEGNGLWHHLDWNCFYLLFLPVR